MALDDLLGVLEREAAEERAALLARARADAAQVMRAAQERADRAVADASSASEQDERDAMALEAAAARRRSRTRVLAARDALLARVFADVERRLPGTMADAAYRDALPGIMRDAMALAGERAGIIRGPGAIMEALKAGGLPVVADESLAGFQVVSADEALVIDATLGGLLERRHVELAQLVLAELEAGA